MITVAQAIAIGMVCLIIGAFFGMIALAMCHISSTCSDDDDESVGYEAGTAPPEVKS